MGTIQDDIRNEIKASAKSIVESRFQQLEDTKRRELAEVQRTRQAAIDALENDSVIERWLNSENGDDVFSIVRLASQHNSADSQEEPAQKNSAHSTPTRKAMLDSVLPGFKGKSWFIRRDVEAQILELWPEAKPSTETEYKNFSSGIAGNMSKLVKKGQLEAKDGDTPFDPREYRWKEDYEDTLLKPET